MGDCHVGLVGFEPTACRRGARSIITERAHLYLGRSWSIARVELLPNAWQNFRCGPKPKARHAASLWTHRRCDDEFVQSNPRKNRRSAVRFFGCAIRNSKTFLIIIC